MQTNYPAQIEKVDIDKLQFDPENPRLPTRVTSTNDSEVLDFMIHKANIAELMGSISEQGFFPGEPLLVVPSITEIDAYFVVEGNRRLAAIKLLLHPERAPSKRKTIEGISNGTTDEIKSQIKKLPVLIFEHRDHILEYLGYRHITGIQTWGPLAKAKYLEQLTKKKQREMSQSSLFPDLAIDNLKQLDATIAKEIGSRADYVGQMLAGLAVYENIKHQNFFDIADLDEESLEFAVLYTALGYTNISHFVGMEDRRDRELRGLDLDNLRYLTTWMFQRDDTGSTILGESRNLEKLSHVVGDPEACRLLKNGSSLEAAHTQSKGPKVSFLASLQQTNRSLSEAWNQFSYVQNVGEDEQQLIREIVRVAVKLRGSIEDAIISKDNS